MNKATIARNEKVAQKVCKALESRNFEAYYCANKKRALDQIVSLIDKNDVVSWGGSETLEEMGIQKTLIKEGYQVIDRDTAKTPEERVQLMRQALSCDTFLMSTNAISEDGQLVNLDGVGNRVAALAFGPKQVIVVAGMNKLVKTLEDAISRTRTIAAPTNAQRFDVKTPCKTTGSCADCTSADCICANMVITRMSKPAKKIKVILVGEDFGL